MAPASTMSLMGKARSTSPVWSNSVSGQGDGTNIYISRNQVSFLLETLTYTPNFNNQTTTFAKEFNDPNIGENTFTVVVPNLPTPYVGANYFTGNPSGTTGSEHNGSVGTSYTHSAYTAGSVTVGGYTFSNTVTLDDAAIGDIYLEGFVGSDSLGQVGSDYGQDNSGGTLSGWTNGDFFNEGGVFSDSLGAEGSAYGLAGGGAFYGVANQGTGPATVGVPADLIGGSAVPEPASLALLSLASLGLTLGRRNRKSV
jgi:hypothetical protein